MTEGVELHIEFEKDGDKTSSTFSVLLLRKNIVNNKRKWVFTTAGVLRLTDWKFY
jgi:hypothetical protein